MKQRTVGASHQQFLPVAAFGLHSFNPRVFVPHTSLSRATLAKCEEEKTTQTIHAPDGLHFHHRSGSNRSRTVMAIKLMETSKAPISLA